MASDRIPWTGLVSLSYQAAGRLPRCGKPDTPLIAQGLNVVDVMDPSLDERLVRTDDGSLTLRHAGHGECYHSSLGARKEARMLYVERSGLIPALASTRTRPLAVLDVGLGLGYNALATLSAWHAEAAPCSLTLVSLEHDATLVTLLASGEAPWQREWAENERAMSQKLIPNANGTQFTASVTHPQCESKLQWTVLLGDAYASLAKPREATEAAFEFDFIWQDPFSPELNPTLWNGAWFHQLRQVAAADCTLATYSVARTVKDALTEAGWSWRRLETGIPRKRHWLLASPAAAAP